MVVREEVAVSIVPLDAAGLDRAAAMLARAFRSDPMVERCLPGPSPEVRLGWLFSVTLRYALRHGVVETTPSLDAVSAWLPPGQAAMTLPRMARAGMLAAPVRIGLRACLRLNGYHAFAARLRREAVGDRCWYLQALGVDPTRQRMRIGGALLRSGIERAAKDPFPSYLETTNPQAVPFYERHGFRVAIHRSLRGLEVWGMARPAEGPGTISGGISGSRPGP